MGSDPRLPGVDPDPDAVDPIVLHVDADCFYAACERLRDPELRDEPLVVGMGYEAGDDTGAVATASYEARAYGVESAMAISQALDALPRRAAAEAAGESTEDTGYYRPVDMSYYESVSEDVREILHESADVVREVSIDEAYLDVTERTAWSVVEGLARHVKERIRREVGIPVSIGVAPTMSAAKIASDYDKPDGLTVVQPDEIRSFLAPLDVAEIHGVGPVTARKLREMGLETAGDVAVAAVDELVEAFGERGRELYDYARGEDDRRVTPRGLPKSFSRESAVGDPVVDRERKRELLVPLAESVADRATREGALYRTVGVKAVTPPYDVNTRERSLPGPVDDPELVVEIALDLFEEFADDRVRKLGVRLANLEFSGDEQTDLGGWESTEGGEADCEPENAVAGTPANPSGSPDQNEPQHESNGPSRNGEGGTAVRSASISDWATVGSSGVSSDDTVESRADRPTEESDEAGDEMSTLAAFDQPEASSNRSPDERVSAGLAGEKGGESGESVSSDGDSAISESDASGSDSTTSESDASVSDSAISESDTRGTNHSSIGTDRSSAQRPPPGFTGQTTLSQYAGRE